MTLPFTFQLIPARGRKHLPADISNGSGRTIPVRGRKLICFASDHFRVGTIPARGRKQDTTIIPLPTMGTIPVRGRKLRPTIDIFEPLSTIPVRGRKLNLSSRCFHNRLYISTYPRKGTETCGSGSYGKDSIYFNLSPQGDGNIDRHSKTPSDPVPSPQGDGNYFAFALKTGG